MCKPIDMYACVYVYVHAYTYIHIHVHMKMCVYISICTFTGLHLVRPPATPRFHRVVAPPLVASIATGGGGGGSDCTRCAQVTRDAVCAL